MSLGGHPLWGHLFETIIAGELRKQMSLLLPAPRLCHWRSTGGAEEALSSLASLRAHSLQDPEGGPILSGEERLPQTHLENHR